MPKKKQLSKLKRTLNWLKPTSAKKGALFFAIAFAIIGGSYMAYQSFAATNESKLFDINSFNGINSGCGLTRLVDTESTSKSNSQVMKMSANNDGCLFDGRVNPYMIADAYWSSWVPVNMRLCVYVRGAVNTGDNTQFFAHANFNTTSGQIILQVEPTTIHGSRDYQKLCSSSKLIPAGNITHNIYVGHTDKDHDVYFAWASLEYSPAQ